MLSLFCPPNCRITASLSAYECNLSVAKLSFFWAQFCASLKRFHQQDWNLGLMTSHQKEQEMSISKQYLKTKPACKVTFVVPAEQAQAVESVAVVGEFNNWEAALMKKQKYDLSECLPKSNPYRSKNLWISYWIYRINGENRAGNLKTQSRIHPMRTTPSGAKPLNNVPPTALIGRLEIFIQF